MHYVSLLPDNGQVQTVNPPWLNYPARCKGRTIRYPGEHERFGRAIWVFYTKKLFTRQVGEGFFLL